MITEVEDYFTSGCGRCARFATPDCSARRWIAGLTRLRRICLDAGLTETLKWAHPCYTHRGRNIAILGAFRSDFRITFFNAELLADPDGLLENAGPGARHGSVIRFDENDRAAATGAAIRAFLQQAMRHAESGLRPARRVTEEPEMPPELICALKADARLAQAFAALTPGRRKSYVLAVAEARKPETRTTRIAKFRDRILSGKGATGR